MRIRLLYLLAAGAVAAMVGAPVAAADDQNCVAAGAGTECSSPGNVEINDSPPPVADNPFSGGFYPGPYPVPFDEGNR